MVWIKHPTFALSCIFLLIAPGIVRSQDTQATPPPATPVLKARTSGQESTTPVFHASTRLVLVDVVVTDHHGQFIPGMRPRDFTVFEDGKPQKISAFATHISPKAPEDKVGPLKLPPYQFCNFSHLPQESDRPITIVLLDMLNTSGQEQQYARKQMIKFLQTLPEGRQVALFTLTSKLNMIQGFTEDSATLVKAANTVMAKSSLALGSETQMQLDQITAWDLHTIAQPEGIGPQSSGTGQVLPIAPIGRALRYAVDSQDSFQKLQRMQLTIQALEALARAVTGYSGRKNLLWLSSEFPIAFGPGQNPYNQASAAINNTETTPDAQTNHQLHNLEYETPPLPKTAALLAAAQVAVYPINVSGIVNPGTGMDISTYTANLFVGDLQQQTQIADQRQTDAKWDIHESMSDIARETGGEAFYGTNNLKEALTRGMEEGSNYYTLAYAPANPDWSGQYRRIEVKGASGAKLTYRRGYYAVPEHPYTGDKMSAAMALAMKFSVPEFTMLFMKVQVLPPDFEHPTVRIDYAVDAHDMTFSETPDQRIHASVDFVATAWNKDLKLVAHTAETMETNLRPQAYQQVLRTGLPFHQELDVKPGRYILRLGVLDRGSQKLGTVDVPLVVENFSGTTVPQ